MIIFSSMLFVRLSAETRPARERVPTRGNVIQRTRKLNAQWSRHGFILENQNNDKHMLLLHQLGAQIAKHL